MHGDKTWSTQGERVHYCYCNRSDINTDSYTLSMSLFHDVDIASRCCRCRYPGVYAGRCGGFPGVAERRAGHFPLSRGENINPARTSCWSSTASRHLCRLFCPVLLPGLLVYIANPPPPDGPGLRTLNRNHVFTTSNRPTLCQAVLNEPPQCMLPCYRQSVIYGRW